MSAAGRVLMINRGDGNGWSQPTLEECRYRLGDVDEFTPRIDYECAGWGWFSPEAALELGDDGPGRGKKDSALAESFPVPTPVEEPEDDHETIVEGVDRLKSRMALLELLNDRTGSH
jgi:hypothetical protein